MKNRIQDGTTISFIADKSYKSGDPVVLGNMIGICVGDFSEKEKHCIAQTSGVFELKKNDGVIKTGDKLLWTPDGIAKAEPNGEFHGYAWADIEKTSVLCWIKLK